MLALGELFLCVKDLVINHIAKAHIPLPTCYCDCIFRGRVPTPIFTEFILNGFFFLDSN